MVVEDPSVTEDPTAVAFLSEERLLVEIAEPSMARSPAVLPSSSSDAYDQKEAFIPSPTASHVAIDKDQPTLELEASRESSDSITSSQFDDIEEVLSSARESLSLPSIKNHLENYKNLSPKAKKRARKQQRQAYREADNLVAKVLRNKVDKGITSSLTREAFI